MDGNFYNDSVPPWCIVAPGAVTLSTTNKALYPPGFIKPMGGAYWWAGKWVEIEIIGQMTSGATPGNLTLALLYGSGADSTGTSICASTAQAWTGGQTNNTFRAKFQVMCTASGAAGALFGTGFFKCNEASIAAEIMIPGTAPATTTALDLTVATNVLSIQAARSGSTAETMQVLKIITTPKN